MKPYQLLRWVAAVLLLMIPFLAVSTGSSDSAVLADFKRHVETKNGMTCAELSQQAMGFVERAITPLMLVGRNGKDWVALSDKSMLHAIRSYKDKTFQCHLLKSNAERLGITMSGEFDTLQQLFSALDTFITFGGVPPSVKGLKPGAFERIDALYRNLTLP